MSCSSVDVRESISATPTASSSYSIVLERWTMRDNQTGWQGIHEGIINFRKEKRISIKSFLSMCGLPKNRSFFQQLCCKSGCNLHPSSNVGSPGKQFLDAVKSFFQNSEPLIIQPTGGNIDDLLCDLKLEDNDEFQDLGISGIVFHDEKHCIVISCLGKAKEEEIHSFLKKKLGAEVDKITLEFRRIELLYSTPPYRALSAGARHDSICSTNTNLTGALAAITCAHGVSQVESDFCKNTETENGEAVCAE
eukprot:gene31330-40706_t